MITTRSDFEKRCAEIEEYIQHISQQEAVTAGMSTTLMSTMKASGILMIYNLIESTMTNVLQAVFDHLEVQNVCFVNVNEKVKIAALNNAKKRSPKALVSKMKNEAQDLVVASFEREEAFSGNVDAETIRKVLSEFGVNKTASYEEEELHLIRKARNELAHGATSFADYGKHLTAAKLNEKYTKAKKILAGVIKDVGTYLAGKKYL